MSRRSWAVAGLLVLATAAGAGANAIDRDYLASGWQDVADGSVGADLAVGEFQVQVHGAQAGPDLEDGEVVTSPGMFLLVDLSYATTRAWDTPEEVVLLDGQGREFTNPSGFGSTGQPWEAGPDIWLRGDLLFEVPADALDGLVLEIRPQRTDPRLPSSALRIPLEAEVSTEPLSVARPEVLPGGQR